MLKTRDGRVVAGLGLVVMGFALLLAALAFEHERGVRVGERTGDAQREGGRGGGARGQPVLAASGGAPAMLASSTVTAIHVEPGGRLATDAGAQAAKTDAAIGLELAAVDAGDIGRGTDASAGHAATDGRTAVFRFLAGGANMNPSELARLLAAGKVVAAHPEAAVSIEGFPDKPGNEPMVTGVALSRARTGQALLVQAGVSLKQISITTGELDPARKLTRAIRITVDPPVPELETP